MRIPFGLLILIAVSAGGGAWWWSSFDESETRSRLAAEAARKSSATALRMMLTDHEVYSFKSVVIGTSTDARSRDFRALVTIDGSDRPAFGQASFLCTSDEVGPECWQLSDLWIDGANAMNAEPRATVRVAKAPAPAAAMDQAKAESSSEASDAQVSGEQEGAEAQVAALAASPDAQVVPQAPEGADIAPAAPTASESATPLPTHVISVSQANVRSGPGRNNGVLFRLSEGSPLKIGSTERGWGRFTVLDGDNSGDEVWIALSVVDEVSQDGSE